MPLLIPSEVRKADLRYIHKNLLEHRSGGDVSALSKSVARMLEIPEFREHVANNKSLQSSVRTEADLLRMAWGFVYCFLYKRDYVTAALTLWSPGTFTPEPRAAQMMWDALFTRNLINVMGCASAGKTYCPSAWCLLDWVLDPEWTRVQVVSNSADHVKKNLFADIVRLHGEASLELPGKVDSESISLNKKRAMGIFILTIPGGPTSRGKLKGAKVKKRPTHPLFGDNSRLRIILDEAQEIAANVWDDIPNLLASVDDSIEHIKILCAANPKLEFSRYGQHCKPIGGWDKVSDDAEEWDSDTGWRVISINALRTENVIQRKTVFPRMITYEGVQKIIKSQGGGDPNHPICFTYLYGRFPKGGVLATVIKLEHLRNCEGEWIFDSATTSKAGGDPAYVGDRPALACGRVGRAIGWIDYQGDRHMLDEPKMAIQVDAVTVMPHGDTQELADRYMEHIKPLNVKPEGFGIDMTGSRGTYDIVRRQWVQKIGPLSDGSLIAPIHGIEYAASPSIVRIAEEDTATPKELYNIMASELWFAAAKLFEYGVVRLGKGVDLKVFSELAARQGGMQPGLGKKLAVESKKDFKARTGMDSPDLADATLIMLHVARITTPGLIPRAKDTKAAPPAERISAWDGFNSAFGAVDFDMPGNGGMVDVLRD